MRTNTIFSTIVHVLALLIVLTLPLFHESAQQWVLAIAVSALIYRGASELVVWEMLALLLAVELLYGVPLGVTSIAFLLAVMILMAVRRFIVIPAWSTREGWRITDIMRTIFVSLLLYAVTIVLSVGIGNVLYRIGFVGARLTLLWNPQEIIVVLIVTVVTCMALRRIDVPFRQEIHFGI